MTRICRVVPDVAAVAREFDYEVPEALAAHVRVGTIVRVPLHGRRVRGWVVADDAPPVVRDRLLPVHAVVSEGPPPDVVELSAWIAHRWCGPRVAVLRSASPPNRILPGTLDRAAAPAGPGFRAGLRRTPPLRDRRPVIEELLAPSGSTIVVVADGARAANLARALARGGRSVALVHSDAPAAARTQAWRLAAAGRCVVVGGRVGALAPVPDLGAVILVDDADEALQAERVPTWHAREVSYERARRAGAVWTVCSPAPTVEAEALAGRPSAAPPRDVELSGWPRVLVVDRREERPGSGLLSDALARALDAAAGPAVCVLNRRGRFRLLACDACHELARWGRDDVRPEVCDGCGSTRLRVLRAGVTRVREELAALVPRRRVAEVDASTSAIPDAEVLIGTESVLHRADVRRARPSLVALLDLDQELLAPRFRAATQAHWLATRGAQLLAGRPRSEGLLLVQTRVPDHVVVRALVHADPRVVVDAEAAQRRALAYPPFGALAELTGDDEALAVAGEALRGCGAAAIGPSNGRLLVRAEGWDLLADRLVAVVPHARAAGRVRVAVDPPRV